MPTRDELYNEPIQRTYREELRDTEGTKGQLFDRLEEIYVGFLAGVAGAATFEATRRRLNEGLEELTRASIQAIESAQAQARNRMREAHLEGYSAAASQADIEVPDWNPPSGVDPYERAPFDGDIETFVRGSIEEEVSFFKQDLKFIRKYVEEDRYAKAVAQVLARGDEDIKRRLLDRGIDLDDFDPDALKSKAAEIFQNSKTMGSPDIRGILKEIDPQDLAEKDPALFRRIEKNGTDAMSRILDEVAKDLAVHSPAVQLVEWELSDRHNTLESSPDECDVLALQDLYGFGSGMYHPKTTPPHPHPFCECQIRVVTRDPSDWSTQKNERPKAFDIREDEVRELMQQVKAQMNVRGRAVTDTHVSNTVEIVEEAVAAAHNNPR